MRPSILSLVALLLLLAPAGTAHALQTPEFNARVLSLVVTPTDPPTLYALVEQSGPWAEGPGGARWLLFRSGDGGHAWEPYTMRGLDASVAPRSLTLDYRATQDTLYLAIGRSLYRSRGGSDWVQAGAVPEPFGAVAVDFLDPNVLYGGLQDDSTLGGAGQFVRSVDGGRTWAPFDAAAPPAGQLDARTLGPIRQLLVDATDPSTLYALAAYTYRRYLPSLWRGDRQGHWVQLPLPPVPAGGQGADGLAFDAAGGALYTGSYGWGGGAAQPDPATRSLWRAANPRQADPARVAWRAVQTWDYGTWGWYASTPSVLPLAVDAGRNRALYLQTHGADAALWKSPDGGQSWQPLPIPRLQGEAVPGGGQEVWVAPTGHPISGEWLRFLKAHGDTANLGYPRTPVIADPVAGGQVVQYFQRAVLEWHPEAPPAYRLQRRLLGDLLDPGADPLLSEEELAAHAAAGEACFPPGPGLGLGQCVGDLAPDGTAIHFLEHFTSRGGVDAFGFPKEGPRQRNGRWTQRFQAAVFESHPEYDVDGTVPGTNVHLRNFRVQLGLLGDRYLESWKLPYR
ncbi:MAG: hypothetical protein HY690_05115 [Chloroflexi bacterium]|nr:hypothetical protein [Chloroflexota bacterium]